MIWVIDASVALKWFLKDEFSANADRVLHRVLSHSSEFAVPELFAFEVLSVLARVTDDPERIYVNGVIPILNSGILRFPVTEELVHKAIPYIGKGLTGYDAVYVALAEMLGGQWLTFDQKAHKKISRLKRSLCLKQRCPV